jgi:hypothetical protein
MLTCVSIVSKPQRHEVPSLKSEFSAQPGSSSARGASSLVHAELSKQGAHLSDVERSDLKALLLDSKIARTTECLTLPNHKLYH